MTRLPPSPFLSCSGEFPSFSPVEAAALMMPPLRDAAAEIPGAWVQLAPGPAAVPFASPLAAAGDVPETCFDCGERDPCDEECPNYIPSNEGRSREALPAVADPHETGRALGAIPLDYETILKALESCLHEDWIFGIDEPDPMLLFLETFPLNAREQA